MFGLPSNIRAEDIRQWLNGGVYLAETEQGVQPMLFHETSHEGIIGTVATGPKAGKRLVTKKSKVLLHWPKCGSVNLASRGYALYIDRQLRRQWSRTYRPQHVSIIQPHKWDATIRHGKDVRHAPHHPDIVEALFFPEYFSFEEATRLLEKGSYTSVALNPHVILAGSSKKYIMYYKGELSATIEVAGGGKLLFNNCGKKHISLSRVPKLLGTEVDYVDP